MGEDGKQKNEDKLMGGATNNGRTCVAHEFCTMRMVI